MYQLLALLLTLGYSAIAQDSQYLSAGDSDPAAKEKLEQMESFISGFDVLEAKFNTEFHYPEEETYSVSGDYYQQGDNLRIMLEQYNVYSDGKVMWVHDIENGEVTMQDAESEQYLTLRKLLSMYKDEDYVYRMVDPGVGSVVSIEFKPLDRNSEHTKLRLTVDRSTAEPAALEVFEKDGSRIILTIEEVHRGTKRDPSWYHFDAKAHPELKVEDLRID